MRESQINVAYRWFLRLRLTDKMRTDSSTFSQNRRQQFRDSDIAQRLFDHLTQ
jgi:transposase